MSRPLMENALKEIVGVKEDRYFAEVYNTPTAPHWKAHVYFESSVNTYPVGSTPYCMTRWGALAEARRIVRKDKKDAKRGKETVYL